MIVCRQHPDAASQAALVPTMTEKSVNEGHFERFVELSVELTGFTEAELAVTGMARAYFHDLALVVGEPLVITFLSGTTSLKGLLGHLVFGPIALNVIRMWYLGEWKRLSDDWRQHLKECSEREQAGYDIFKRDVDRVISAEAYREGLVWSAIGTHPVGAKQPGFATWGAPPR